MPNKDRYHDTVVNALKNAGWRVTAEQVAIVLVERRLWIDIKAVKNSDNIAILVEVKGFENMASPVEYLAAAVGKYVLYRSLLDYVKTNLPLYMAVPEAAYTGVLSEEVGRETLQRVNIKLIVFDPEREEITRWID